MHILQHDDTTHVLSDRINFHVTRNERYVLTNSSLLLHGLRNNLK